ncbi:hypothetical protein MMC22_005485 [Lobaria immixta]|nr:hypothetical protein [Lobaria immixta]
MFSPLSSFIYYPCIDSIAKDLGVTVELINLTITSYMIVSGIAPAIIGDFADMVGRRPIYMITFTIYFAANVGLAAQRSYPALLILKMIQSAGASVNGIFYMSYVCIQASLSSLFIDIYGFKELGVGLVYLPFGLGCLIASFVSGKIMDRDYRVTAKANGVTIQKVEGDDLAEFRIESARFRSSGYLITVAIVSVFGYGWALDTKVHFGVPLVLQFFIGASITGVFNMCGTLLTDVHPRNPATAQASSNIVRCALSATGLAALQALIANIGPGWTFTVFAALCLATIPMIVAEIRWGLQWRQERNATQEARQSGQQGLPIARDPAVSPEALEDQRLKPIVH